MRLFAAVRPSPEVLAEVATSVETLAPDVRLRWTSPEQWHLTLAFYGEVTDQVTETLDIRLRRLAARTAPLTLRCSGAGAFARPSRARVLWIGVQGDREGLIALAASARAAGRRSGLDMPDRGYRPHLSIARARASADLATTVAQLSPFASAAWTVHELSLLRSELGKGDEGRPRYTTIGDYPLAG